VLVSLFSRVLSLRARRCVRTTQTPFVARFAFVDVDRSITDAVGGDDMASIGGRWMAREEPYA